MIWFNWTQRSIVEATAAVYLGHLMMRISPRSWIRPWAISSLLQRGYRSLFMGLAWQRCNALNIIPTLTMSSATLCWHFAIDIEDMDNSLFRAGSGCVIQAAWGKHYIARIKPRAGIDLTVVQPAVDEAMPRRSYSTSGTETRRHICSHLDFPQELCSTASSTTLLARDITTQWPMKMMLAEMIYTGTLKLVVGISKKVKSTIKMCVK